MILGKYSHRGKFIIITSLLTIQEKNKDPIDKVYLLPIYNLNTIHKIDIISQLNLSNLNLNLINTITNTIDMTTNTITNMTISTNPAKTQNPPKTTT